VKIRGRDVRVVSTADRLRPPGSEVERLLCDNTRAREWAGWKPEVDLEEGLRKTAEWAQANPGPGKASTYHV
jgi:nucleoside-diphosphate-sugar epimerase